MSWDRLPRIYREIAQAVCTPAELDALAYHLTGYSEREIATILGITRSSVQARLDRATRKISSHPDMPKEPAA